MPLPVYVINLDRRPDRWQTISARLDQLKMRVTRVPAFRHLDVYRYRGPLTMGEMACAMSHCAALRLLLETEAPAALILEDDVELASDIPVVLNGVGWWPEGSGLIKLDNPYGKPRVMGGSVGATPSGRDLHRIVLSQAGAGAYLVDRHAAETVIEAFVDPVLPIDVALFSQRYSMIARSMRPVQAAPAMAFHDHEGSDLQAERLMAGRHKIRASRRPGMIAMSMAQKIRVFGLRMIGRARKYPLPFRDLP